MSTKQTVNTLDLSALLESAPPSDPTRRIYSNRNLNMAEINAIGFDMDYTLAQYFQHSMDELSIRKTIEKLIENCGYPEEIRNAQLDHDFIIRGLVVDKQNGYIFKPDEHRLVGRCYHGYQQISEEEKLNTYGGRPISIGNDRFISVDTLFSLPESTLMAGIIQHYKNLNQPLPKTATELCNDIRKSIDQAHQDNSLKAEILADLPKYVIKDPDLAPTLHKLKSIGKKLFLLTNSELYYTEAVMSYMLNNELPFFESWKDYFDVIIVHGSKPSFFTDRKPFVALDEQGKRLTEEVKSFAPRRVYAYGNILDFEKMMNLAGDDILYVGDHVYSDIVKSKRSAWWRTALVIQEMKEGIHLTIEQAEQFQKVYQLEAMARRLDDDINYHRTLSRSLERVQKLLVALTSPETHVIDSTRDRTMKEISKKEEILQNTLKESQLLEDEIENKFNKYWGWVFREKQELSLFGDQVQSYADIYTSQVSNFLFYSPNQYFRAPRDFMPHEREHLKLV
jgi:5'-nucleotidase